MIDFGAILETVNHNNADWRNQVAVIYYILLNICKKLNKWQIINNGIKTEYESVDYEEIKWIVDRVNFSLAKSNNSYAITTDFFSFMDELTFVPEVFIADYTAVYSYTEKKLIDSGTKPFTYQSFIAPITSKTLNKVILRYKLYGKLCVHISRKWYWFKQATIERFFICLEYLYLFFGFIFTNRNNK